MGVDLYRDAGNQDSYRPLVRAYVAHERPVVVAEFGCCMYRGAPDRGALQRLSEGRRASEGVRRAVEAHRSALEAYERLCRELGEEPANVALAWLLHNPVVTAPIIGPRTREQLDGSLRALEITLPAEVLRKLDEIFPGPGGPAPEAYAW